MGAFEAKGSGQIEAKGFGKGSGQGFGLGGGAFSLWCCMKLVAILVLLLKFVHHFGAAENWLSGSARKRDLVCS